MGKPICQTVNCPHDVSGVYLVPVMLVDGHYAHLRLCRTHAERHVEYLDGVCLDLRLQLARKR